MPTPDGELAIDTGFIVHNRRTYPTLLRLFAELGIATQPSEMSLSVSDAGTGVEYAGALGARGLFAQRSSLRSRDHWRMLLEIPRFHRRARRARCSPTADGSHDRPTRRCATSSRDGGFSAGFVRHFMEPLVAAVWSCDPATSLDYPARYLFTFLEHHGMLGVFGSPEWRTVTGGSGDLRRRGRRRAPGRSALETKVTSVRELADRVEVTDGSGTTTTFDAVVVATHPSQALGDARVADRRSSARSSPRCPTAATPRCCTPTPRCSRAPRDARASLELPPPGRRRPARSRSPTTSPASSGSPPTPTTSSPWAARTSSTRRP